MKNVRGCVVRAGPLVARMAFAPDGSLWVGQTDHGWAGAQGIQRIVFTGATPMDIYDMKLTTRGFDLSFTLPVDATTARDPGHYRFRHYYYDYYKKEPGEPVDTSVQLDVQPVEVTDVAVSPDGKTVSLSLERLRPGYIYELKLSGITSEEGTPLANNLICYTLNRLIDTGAQTPSVK